MQGVASMTGYGRSAVESGPGLVTVEIRSLNHRHLDIMLRSPRGVMRLDPEIRKMVRDRVSRGKVEIFVTVEDRHGEFAVDADRALEVARSLAPLAASIGDRVRLEHILSLGEIARTGECDFDEKNSGLVISAVGLALDKMLEHRLEEGRALSRDLIPRMEELTSVIREIESMAPEITDRSRVHLLEFLRDLDLGEKVDPQRLEMEVAIQAQRSDITEEITRLVSHRDAFLQSLERGGVIGRRLDFLVQEIHREINTIGSKSGMPEISARVVDFKTGLEKIREQVQNIE